MVHHNKNERRVGLHSKREAVQASRAISCFHVESQQHSNTSILISHRHVDFATFILLGAPASPEICKDAPPLGPCF